jgi:6-phosphofructokinase 1
MKKIGVFTSGGDSSGMNPAIRAVVRTGIKNGLEIIGIKRGYAGLLEEDYQPLTSRSVGDILQRGGTILKTARCPEFQTPAGFKKALKNFKKAGFDGLVAIGGDGTFRGALELAREGIKIIGIPGTIDNDLSGTDFTLGFDTALNIVLEAIKKIRDTASAMERAFVLEVMGRSSGWLALTAGLAGGCESVLIPEVPFKISTLCQRLKKAHDLGKTHSIIVLAEGAGSAFELAEKIKGKIGFELKVSVLGHIQRGGSPSVYDRFLGSLFGKAAVDLLTSGKTGKMVGIRGNVLAVTDLEKAVNTKRKIDLSLYKLAKVLDQPYRINKGKN